MAAAAAAATVIHAAARPAAPFPPEAVAIPCTGAAAATRVPVPVQRYARHPAIRAGTRTAATCFRAGARILPGRRGVADVCITQPLAASRVKAAAREVGTAGVRQIWVYGHVSKIRIAAVSHCRTKRSAMRAANIS